YDQVSAAPPFNRAYLDTVRWAGRVRFKELLPGGNQSAQKLYDKVLKINPPSAIRGQRAGGARRQDTGLWAQPSQPHIHSSIFLMQSSFISVTFLKKGCVTCGRRADQTGVLAHP